MFQPLVDIEINTSHKRIAYRSKVKELSFQNLQECSSQHLISKSYDKFTIATVLI